MEYLPLLFLGLVVVGGVVILRSMIRLKQAAVEALEASRRLDEQLQELRIKNEGQAPPFPNDKPPPG